MQCRKRPSCRIRESSIRESARAIFFLSAPAAFPQSARLYCRAPLVAYWNAESIIKCVCGMRSPSHSLMHPIRLAASRAFGFITLLPARLIGQLTFPFRNNYRIIAALTTSSAGSHGSFQDQSQGKSKTPGHLRPLSPKESPLERNRLPNVSFVSLNFNSAVTAFSHFTFTSLTLLPHHL